MVDELRRHRLAPHVHRQLDGAVGDGAARHGDGPALEAPVVVGEEPHFAAVDRAHLVLADPQLVDAERVEHHDQGTQAVLELGPQAGAEVGGERRPLAPRGAERVAQGLLRGVQVGLHGEGHVPTVRRGCDTPADPTPLVLPGQICMLCHQICPGNLAGVSVRRGVGPR